MIIMTIPIKYELNHYLIMFEFLSNIKYQKVNALENFVFSILKFKIQKLKLSKIYFQCSATCIITFIQ